ncbi:MAG: SIS domain-containing protein [Actinobacteria bacterium]|nr:MAG: SIS domain-containing protein [Actinomycetota bacterium]
MAAEMADQPDVLARLVARRGECAAALEDLAGDDLKGIVIVARGSSDYAAVYGRYLLELRARRPVTLAAPSLVTHYGARTPMEGWLAVAVSQSGRTPEITNVLKTLASDGARTLAITNGRDSPLAAAADWTLHLDAGDERAVPATKTFTAQLAAVALLAEALGDTAWPDDHWAAAVSAVRDVLQDDERPTAAARRLDGADRLVTIGRGLLFGVALEVALKARETTGILAEGWSSSDYRHGPIAASGEHVPAVAVHAAGPTQDDVRELVADLRERGSLILEITDDEAADLPIPSGLPEALAALPAAVRAQQLALALSLARGLDPDTPAGLSKVTAT